MDSFDVKLEKRKAILRYRQLRSVASLLRIVEIVVVLVMISRVTPQLPSAVKSSGVYFRDLSVVVASPRFVFLLGNMIVITLFAKSGKFASQKSASGDSITNLCEEFLEKSQKNQANQRYETGSRGKQRKQRICEERKDHVQREMKSLRRTQSENLSEVNSNQTWKQLERSETQKCIKWTDSCEGVEKSCYPEDEMSNEEFRNAIEAFIARQKRFLREEEYSYLLEPGVLPDNLRYG